MNRYTLGWVVIVLAGVALETMAIIDPGAGDTLTEHIRPLLAWHPAIWFCGLGMAAWAVRHLFWNKR
jgi:hypothetical protein